MVEQPEGKEVAIREATIPEIVQLTEQSIATIQHNILMAEKLVIEVLERDVDYGIHPGTNSMALRDSGASKIANAFNTYPKHIILYHQEDENIITFHIQALLISRGTREIVAVGMGACSTLESKYGNRWVENPEDYGYNREDLTRKRGGKYRIRNPEITDLGHTILLMACKRAEGDACKNLPGVGSALVKVFDNKIKSQPHGQQSSQSQTTGRKENPWTQFWGKVTQLGLTPDEARVKLGVKSMKEWTNAGGTIETAITALAAAIAQDKTGQARQLAESRATPERTEGEFSQGVQSLLRICHEDFGMQPADVFKELGYPNQAVFEEAGFHHSLYETYLGIKSVREQTEETVEEQQDLPF